MSYPFSSRWVANEWRKLWHPAGFVMPAARTALRTARWRRLPDDPGEDRDPVLVALAGPHDDVARLEVDVLHAKPSALEQPQAGAVEKARHELRRPRELCDHRAHLVTREDDREATRTTRAYQLVEPWQLHTNDLPVEEEACSRARQAPSTGPLAAICTAYDMRTDYR